MKKTKNLTENLLKQFDKELRAIVTYDLKLFKSDSSKFFRNTLKKSQGNDLKVA